MAVQWRIIDRRTGRAILSGQSTNERRVEKDALAVIRKELHMLNPKNLKTAIVPEEAESK